ncbi:phage tail protein [Mergibacter septicus]|uniref:phage tail assembly protein n=1 Tax=Mergibacter septicus TaxID=221402 RepID=UPI001C7987D7|nr:phage tail assembly protein [Mergibacter septicus]QDJ13064.1 phage tail protein [Mergibacter septicus]
MAKVEKDLNKKVIKLSSTLKRGETEFSEVEVAKPTVLSLKGLNMINVLNADVDTLTTLLPRITYPMLHKTEIQQLDIADFTELATATIGFFVKTEQTEEVMTA